MGGTVAEVVTGTQAESLVHGTVSPHLGDEVEFAVEALCWLRWEQFCMVSGLRTSLEGVCPSGLLCFAPHFVLFFPLVTSELPILGRKYFSRELSAVPL